MPRVAELVAWAREEGPDAMGGLLAVALQEVSLRGEAGLRLQTLHTRRGHTRCRRRRSP